jgi:hypothetical protein
MFTFEKEIFKTALKFLIGSIIIRVMLKNDLKAARSKCWLFHGSTADMFFICSIYNSKTTFDDRYILASVDHKSILARFELLTSPRVILIPTPRCMQYRKFFSWANLQNAISAENQYLKIPHSVTNDTLYKLVLQNRINYRNALTFQMGVQRHSCYSNPRYTDEDAKVVESIFAVELVDFKSIALINPIAYTHEPFNEDIWRGVFSALSRLGFKCFWNVANNPGSHAPKEYRHFQNCIEIPADLVPLAASMVGVCIAGMGGGFDLLFQFSEKSNCVLLHRSESSNNIYLPNYSLDSIEEKYFEDCGRRLKTIVSITGSESAEDIDYICYRKLKNTL